MSIGPLKVAAAGAGVCVETLHGTEADALAARFPARVVPETWPETVQPRQQVLERVATTPVRADGSSWGTRRRGADRIMQWLQTFPGETWQQRFLASPVQASRNDWKREIERWSAARGLPPTSYILPSGMLALLCTDVVRPSPSWLAGRLSKFFRSAVTQARDPEGFARLAEMAGPQLWRSKSAVRAQSHLAVILTAKGGTLREITIGDCLEMLETLDAVQCTGHGMSLAYDWLRRQGNFPLDTPGTLSMIRQRAGRVSVPRLVDRYQVRNPAIRALLIDYLAERQPAIDYTTLEGLSRTLVLHFWVDLERHVPGIDSLDLAADVADAWKTRLRTKTIRTRRPDGTVAEAHGARVTAPIVMAHVRAFYLDLAQWAVEDPARWGRFAARCPISAADVSSKKLVSHRKARTDQRTRERLPVLPILAHSAERQMKDAKALLETVQAAAPGASFTVAGARYTKARESSLGDPQRTTTVYDQRGNRINIQLVENRTFWAWASIEFLRHTGVRIEEMLETSHHSIVQYTLPSTGEVVPLLQIAPSKTDEERVLLVTPELADVLSAIVSRVRDTATGAIPLVASYDLGEKLWNPPTPLLFQWKSGPLHRALSVGIVRKALDETLEAAGLTDAAGNPLRYQPHDFRRIFITDAILGGLPPHIAQVIAGHANINTTMGYNALYPEAVIEAHRAFIARRRAIRPSEEYRVPTEQEWEAFLGHFERRKLSLGTCGRAYGSHCIHEHACIRCSLLRTDLPDRPRLIEIRDNLAARIAEAEREGWLGEVEGLTVSLAAARDKITQLDATAVRRSTAVHLGMPRFAEIASRTSQAERPTT